jgi:hypothetical protein
MDIKQYLESYQKDTSTITDIESELFGMDGRINKAKKNEKKVLKTRQNELKNLLNEAEISLEKVMGDYVTELIIVPGNEERFKQLEGYSVEVVNLGLPNKGVSVSKIKGSSYGDLELHQGDYKITIGLMLQNDIVGLVEAQISKTIWAGKLVSGYEELYYGLPVRRKEMK